MMKELDLPDGVWFLYELELQHGYHYIGITTNIEHRMAMHNSKKGARVTREHKPISLTAAYRIGYMSYEEAENYEDAYTLLKTIQHNQKWRGGRFCAGCNSKTASRILDRMDEKYKRKLPKVDIEYRFAKVAKKCKAKNVKQKNNTWEKQERKARRELRKSSRMRFGTI